MDDVEWALNIHLPLSSSSCITFVIANFYKIGGL